MSPEAGADESLEEPTPHRYAPPGIEQHDIPWREFQYTTRLVVMVGLAAAAWYCTFIYDRVHQNHPLLWWMTIFAESIVIWHTVGIWLTLLSPKPERTFSNRDGVVRRALVTGELETPPVDVFICHATEPLDMVLPTMIAAQEMILPHNTWVCDDGRNDDLREACQRLGIGYLKRDNSNHAKAGNLNSAIARTNGRYIVVLDADHVPRPDLLVESLPHLMANPSVAMVQTPQTYDIKERGTVAEGAAVSQELFYEATMPAKNNMNAAFCVGTNVVFRRTALESLTIRSLTPREQRKVQKGKGPITDPTGTKAYTLLGEEFPRGGIWVGSNSEDIWTSLELHRRGWRTVFVPQVLTQGLTPESIDAFLKQQFRWSSGGWEVLFWARVLRDRRLTLAQKMQYMLVPSHYALSLAMAIFTFFPLIYILTDRSPISADFWDWAIHYLPFYLLMLAVPFIQAGRFSAPAILVSLAAIPAHVKAFFATAMKRKAAWNVTNAGGSGFSLQMLTPHIAVGVLNIMALVVGLRFGGQDPTSLALAMTFVVIQLAVLAYLIYVSDQAGRLAARIDAATPSDDEALELLDAYLEERAYRSVPSRVPELL